MRGDTMYQARAVILTTGTFLQALIRAGTTSGGRAGEGTTLTGLVRGTGSTGLSPSKNFKTGTPPRVQCSNHQLSKTECQPGDQTSPFSFLTRSLSVEQVPCWITYTTVHDLIRDNLQRAPMYSGQITTTGPRYCPSIEDKVVRFADKEKHQLLSRRDARRWRCTSMGSPQACLETCKTQIFA